MHDTESGTQRENKRTTETSPGRSLLPAARVQKIVKADKVSLTHSIGITSVTFWALGTSTRRKRSCIRHLRRNSTSFLVFTSAGQFSEEVGGIHQTTE